jgi:hypothetical protein
MTNNDVFLFGESVYARHLNVPFDVSVDTKDVDWHPIIFNDPNHVGELVHRHLGAHLANCSVWRIDRHRVVVRVPLAKAPTSATWKHTLTLALAVTESERARTGDERPELSGLFFYASAWSLPMRIVSEDQVSSIVTRTIAVLGDGASEEANDFMVSVFRLEPCPPQDRRDVVVAVLDWTRDESELQDLYSSGPEHEIATAKALLHTAMAIILQRPIWLDLSDLDLGNGRLRVILGGNGYVRCGVAWRRGGYRDRLLDSAR